MFQICTTKFKTGNKLSAKVDHHLVKLIGFKLIIPDVVVVVSDVVVDGVVVPVVVDVVVVGVEPVGVVDVEPVQGNKPR